MAIYFCPLTQKECVEDVCAWWVTKAECCAIVCIAEIEVKIKK